MSVIPFRPRDSAKSSSDAPATKGGSERRRTPDLRTPAVFLSHGSPLAVVEGDFKRALRNFGAHMRQPRAALVVSAHWQGIRPIRVTSSAKPSTLHDFEGFPAWLSSLTYPCPGAPAIADEIVRILVAAGFPAVPDASRGLDSATWLPLSLIYPTGKVPVIQLSLPAPVTPKEMIALGAALAPLRRRGIMLIGSGGIVHNPVRMSFDQHASSTEPWALAFDSWVRERIDAMDVEGLCDYRTKAPSAFLAAPTSEHLDPLFFVLGTRLPGDALHLLFEGFHAGNLSLRSYVLWGNRAEDRRLPDSLALAT